MAVSILMNANKQLIVSSSSAIRQNDIGATIYFIVPTTLPEGTVDSDCTVTLKVLNIGNQLYEYTLTPEDEVYKENYLRYPFEVSSTFSALAGNLIMVLTIKKMNGSLIDYSIHSGELYFNIEKVNPTFGLAINGGSTSSNIVDIVVDGDKLYLVNSEGEKVGSGIATSSDTDDASDGTRDGSIDLDKLLGGA